MVAAPSRDDDGAAAGRDRWFEKSAPDPIERMPAMADIMAAAAKTWTDSFAALSASPGELFFKALRLVRVEELGRHRGALPIFAALKAPSWNAVIGVALDRAVVATVVEAFFGGSEESASGDDGRPVSPVEMRIVDVIAGQAAVALMAGFKDVLPTKFEFERTLPKPEAGFLGKPPTPLIAATFELKTMSRTVEIDVLFPQGIVDVVGLPAEGTSGAPLVDEARWSHQLKAEVGRATMDLTALIEMRPMDLGAIARLRPGQILELPTAATNRVLLTCASETLFRCDLGQSLGFYTVRVDEALSSAHRPPPRKGGRV